MTIRSRLTPYVWMPVIVLLCFTLNLSDNFVLSAPLLIIPISAMVGYRYGFRWSVAFLIGLLSLPVNSQGKNWYFGQNDICATAVFIYVIAGSPWRPPQQVVRASLWFFAAFAILPLDIGRFGNPMPYGSGGQLVFTVGGTGATLFYAILIAAGINHTPRKLVVISLALAATCGIFLHANGLSIDGNRLFHASRAEFPIVGLTGLQYICADYGLNSLLGFLVGLVCYFVGREYGAMLHQRRQPQIPWYLACVLVLVIAMFGINNALIALLAPHFPSSWSQEIRGLANGDARLLAMAALLAGMLLEYRGIRLLLIFSMLMWVVHGRIVEAVGFTRVQPICSLEEPLYVLAFGALGIHLRNVACGVHSMVWSPRWSFFIGLVLLVISSVIGFTGTTISLWILCVIGAMELAVLVSWLYKKLPFHRKRDGAGWLAVGCLILLGCFLLWHLSAAAGIIESYRAGFTRLIKLQNGTDNSWTVLVLMATSLVPLLYLIAVLSALKLLVTHKAELKADALEIFCALTGRTHRKHKGNEKVIVDGEQSKVGAKITSLIGTMRLLLVLFVIAGMLAIIYVQYHQIHDGLGTDSEIQTGVVVLPVQANNAESPSPIPNLSLWKAALAEATGTMTIEKKNVSDFLGTIDTNWYTLPSRPNIRTKAEFYVTDNGIPAVQVFLTREETGLFGVWVQRDFGDSSPSLLQAEEKKIQNSIQRRAEYIARQASGK